jgi:hypothetical protein
MRTGHSNQPGRELKARERERTNTHNTRNIINPAAPMCIINTRCAVIGSNAAQRPVHPHNTNALVATRSTMMIIIISHASARASRLCSLLPCCAFSRRLESGCEPWCRRTREEMHSAAHCTQCIYDDVCNPTAPQTLRWFIRQLGHGLHY